VVHHVHLGRTPEPSVVLAISGNQQGLEMRPATIKVLHLLQAQFGGVEPDPLAAVSGPGLGHPVNHVTGAGLVSIAYFSGVSLRPFSDARMVLIMM
jgi:hypothetical protein